MKRYYALLVLLFMGAIAIGVESRREAAPSSAPMPAQVNTPQPKATAVYEWGEQQIEPFLYAVPLGYFTPYEDVSVFDAPVASANVVDYLNGDIRTGFTSEYHSAEGETWLCVRWNVDGEIMGWECTGWAPASMGTVEREREYAPEDINKSQEA